MKRKSFTILMLASLFFLGACGQSQKNTTTSSTSKSKTSQTTSSSKGKTKTSSTSNASSLEEGAAETSSSVAATTPASSTPQTSAPAKDTEKTTAKDVSNVASFVGTWANDRGESVTINADGSVVVTMSDGNKNDMALWYNQEYSGVGLYTVYAPGASAGSAGLLYIPAGVTNPHIGTTDTRETLVIGQDVSADEHPFYRQ